MGTATLTAEPNVEVNRVRFSDFTEMILRLERANNRPNGLSDEQNKELIGNYKKLGNGNASVTMEGINYFVGILKDRENNPKLAAIANNYVFDAMQSDDIRVAAAGRTIRNRANKALRRF